MPCSKHDLDTLAPLQHDDDHPAPAGNRSAFQRPHPLAIAAGDALGPAHVLARCQQHMQMATDLTCPIHERRGRADNATKPTVIAVPDVTCTVADFAQCDLYGFEGCNFVGRPEQAARFEARQQRRQRVARSRRRGAIVTTRRVFARRTWSGLRSIDGSARRGWFGTLGGGRWCVRNKHDGDRAQGHHGRCGDHTEPGAGGRAG